MNLEDVLNLGPAKRTVELTGSDGEKYKTDIYLRQFSWDLARKTAPVEDQDAVREIIAERIAYSVCDEKGEPIFTKEQIKGTADKSLNSEMVFSLMVAVNEFNGLVVNQEDSEGK